MKRITRPAILATAAILALGAPTLAAVQAKVPPRLAELIRSDADMCREQGGRVELGPRYSQTGDFDGDGADDFLIDQGAVQCSTAASLYCGNSICPVFAFVSSDGYAEPKHIPAEVLDPVVRPQGALSVVETTGYEPNGTEYRLRWMLRGGDWRSARVRSE